MRSKIVRDPIHEYISFSEEEKRLIDSPWFQRLRHCSQNGPTRLVYPSILGTRFEHSLGVMDLASRLFDSILDANKYRKGHDVVNQFVNMCKRDLEFFLGRGRRKKENIIADVRKILRAAGLCHDLGHFPLSHTLERAFRQEFWSGAIPSYFPPKTCHEVVGMNIVRHILETGDSSLEDWVARGVILTILAPSGLEIRYRGKDLDFSRTIFHTLNGIIVGDYDADRLDYLQRDGYLSGSGFGHFDVERFIDAMMLEEKNGVFRVIPSSRALSTIEAALIERYKLYKWVYFHHKTLFFDELCCEVARKLFRKPQTIKGMFHRYGGRVNEPVDYLKRLLRSLSSPGRHLPPLILFRGRDLGLPYSYYEMRPEFFVDNSQSHFFDDVWFCQQCRERKHFGSLGKLYIKALVERQACGITLWKDWSQFTTFFDFARRAAQASSFANKVATENYEVYVPGFLKNLWKLMREGKHPDTAEAICQNIAEEAGRTLKGGDLGALRPIVRIADWRLFGDLRGKQIVGRTGAPDYLINHSTLLKELSDLKGEIPFYVFLVGDESEIKLITENEKKIILTITAEALIKVIADCFDLPEIRQLWTNAVTEAI